MFFFLLVHFLDCTHSMAQGMEMSVTWLVRQPLYSTLKFSGIIIRSKFHISESFGLSLSNSQVYFTISWRYLNTHRHWLTCTSWSEYAIGLFPSVVTCQLSRKVATFSLSAYSMYYTSTSFFMMHVMRAIGTN